MAEMSMLWATNGVGHGAAHYTQAQSNEFFKYFNNANPATAGALSGILNELEVSGVASPLAVDTGYGDVYGFRYWNDASKNVTVTTPAGDRGGRVVLRADWTLQTVTAEVIINAGGAALPSLTQVANTTWEISLASFVIDSSGDIWTDSSKTVAGITDERHFLISPLAGMTLLRRFTGDGTTAACTFDNIQQDLMGLLIVGHARTAGLIATAALQMAVNDLAGTNYDHFRTVSTGVVVAPSTTFTTGTSNLHVADLTGNLMASGETANFADSFRIQIPHYQSALYKSILAEGGSYGIGSGASAIATYLRGWVRTTNPITKILLQSTGGNFLAGSQIALYGLR